VQVAKRGAGVVSSFGFIEQDLGLPGAIVASGYVDKIQ